MKLYDVNGDFSDAIARVAESASTPRPDPVNYVYEPPRPDLILQKRMRDFYAGINPASQLAAPMAEQLMRPLDPIR